MSFKYYPKTCALCGLDFTARNITAKYCDDCKAQAQRQWSAKYRASDKGKATRKRVNERNRKDGLKAVWDHRYNVSEKGRQAGQRYHNSDKGKLADERYNERRRLKKAERCRLKEAVERNEPGAKLKLAKLEGKLTFCERMRVTAYPLPCGTREECRGCEHCPKGADFGLEMRQRDYNYTGGWY